MANQSLTVVLSAYNEEALPADVDVLVVDDGSEDGTADLVRARSKLASSELWLLMVPHGGMGAAVRAGMLAARGDLVVFAVADLATLPDELALLDAPLRDAGSRMHSGVRLARVGSDPFRTPLLHWDVGRAAREQTDQTTA